MSQVETLADQLERAFHGGAWHGPSVAETLAGIDAAAAAARPLPEAHSIWEIVHHLTAWNEVPLRRIDGERLEDVSHQRDWPPVADLSPEAWRTALQALAESHAALRARILTLTEAQLDDPVGGSDPTIRGMLLGVLQHHAYHVGQIALLRKAIQTKVPVQPMA